MLRAKDVIDLMCAREPRGRTSAKAGKRFTQSNSVSHRSATHVTYLYPIDLWSTSLTRSLAFRYIAGKEDDRLKVSVIRGSSSLSEGDLVVIRTDVRFFCSSIGGLWSELMNVPTDNIFLLFNFHLFFVSAGPSSVGDLGVVFSSLVLVNSIISSSTKLSSSSNRCVHCSGDDEPLFLSFSCWE